MSKRKIKISKSKAKGKIESQIEKGNLLFEKGVNIIKSKDYSLVKNRSQDIFKEEYVLWRDLTVEVLNEIFVSPNFSGRFEECKSSKVEYVSADWIPDIKYYIEKQLIPKIDYLNFLIKNLEEFKEITLKECKIHKSLKTSDNTEPIQIKKKSVDKKIEDSISTNEELLELRPNIYGIGINLKVFAKKCYRYIKQLKNRMF